MGGRGPLDGAFRSEASVRGFAPIASDEPAALGGTDSAPNPVEQLLAAFGNCLAVGYAANASVAGIEIRELRMPSTAMSTCTPSSASVMVTPDSPRSGSWSISTPTPMRPRCPNSTGEWPPLHRLGTR